MKRHLHTGQAITTACLVGVAAVVASSMPLPHRGLTVGVSLGAMAQGTPRTIWDGVYTEAQAGRGEQAYKLSCGYCHKDDLSGGFFDDGTGRAPALAGTRAFDSSFEKRWSDQTVREMLVDIGGKMPLQDPASLSIQTYADIISYLFAKNGVPTGAQELSADLEKLEEIRITPKPAK